jgi:transketolase
MSCVEILIALYDHVLTDNDIFILSKGHACWPYYVLLKEKGYSPIMEAHPHMDPSNGVHCTTGSLGHGLPFGLGIALAKKLKKEPGRVYILMGDGECQEGTLWESFLIAKAKKLNNVTLIIDMNDIQGSDAVESIVELPNLTTIASSCGWDSFTVFGHSVEKIATTCSMESGSPVFIEAETTKGAGITFMENDPAWHSQPLFKDEETQAMEELQ